MNRSTICKRQPCQTAYQVLPGRMLKKSSLTYSSTRSEKYDFRITYIFNGLQPSKMAVHPCTSQQAAEKQSFSTACWNTHWHHLDKSSDCLTICANLVGEGQIQAKCCLFRIILAAKAAFPACCGNCVAGHHPRPPVPLFPAIGGRLIHRLFSDSSSPSGNRKYLHFSFSSPSI